MRVIVLGSAAGGGFPQWNANTAACQRARAGDPNARPRTQTSVAITADGAHWFLLNAAPDLRQQIEATPALHPQGPVRGSPIAGVVLTGGDVDAIAGLLTLRERHRFVVYATAGILELLDANPIFDVLDRELVARRPAPIGNATSLVLPDGSPAGLELTLFPVAGKVPLYLETPDSAPPIEETETSAGALVTDGHSQLLFIPGCAQITPAVAQRLRGAAVVLFDGTLWTDDELLRSGAGAKTGLRMGHMSVSGPNGTLAALHDLDIRRKVLVHINNSNPILLDDSPECAEVRAAGWEIAYDGMEFVL